MEPRKTRTKSNGWGGRYAEKWGGTARGGNVAGDEGVSKIWGKKKNAPDNLCETPKKRGGAKSSREKVELKQKERGREGRCDRAGSVSVSKVKKICRREDVRSTNEAIDGGSDKGKIRKSVNRDRKIWWGRREGGGGVGEGGGVGWCLGGGGKECWKGRGAREIDT